jgi:hypothetical protein
MSSTAHEPTDEMPTSSSLQIRRVLLAPICLCLVAALHIWRVNTAGQTPWKGGSFGMFSTIDSEHSRFVHAYVLTSDGPLPIQIPSELEKKVAELRAAPNKEQLQKLAEKLAQRNWVDPEAARQRLMEQLKDRTSNTPLTGEQLRSLRDAAPQTTLVSLRPKTPLVAANRNESMQAISCTHIHVEVWKLVMPSGTTQLVPNLLLTAVAAKGGKP